MLLLKLIETEIYPFKFSEINLLLEDSLIDLEDLDNVVMFAEDAEVTQPLVILSNNGRPLGIGFFSKCEILSHSFSTSTHRLILRNTSTTSLILGVSPLFGWYLRKYQHGPIKFARHFPASTTWVVGEIFICQTKD